MADTLFLQGFRAIHDSTLTNPIDLKADTLKVMLCDANFVPDNINEFVDEGGANDAIDAEIAVTGYVGGWGGAGRKTPSISITSDTINNKLIVSISPNLTWTALGTGATISHAVLIKEGTANDTTSRLIAAWAVPGITNGSDVTLFDATFELTVPA